MHLTKRTSLIILAVTAVVSSRTVFTFINDPEGPNLLIVLLMAAAIYGLSLVAYCSKFLPTSHFKKLLVVLGIQLLLIAGLTFCLR